jgi:3-isopropylmalate dehydrogenase
MPGLLEVYCCNVEEEAMGSYQVMVMAGDGIGPEVVREGRKAIEAAQEGTALKVQFKEVEIGFDHYRRTGVDLAEEEMESIRKADAIYFGSIGLPGITVPMEKASIGKLRQGLDLYANVRPVKLYKGVESLLRRATDRPIDYVIFRENTEGLYTFGKGGFLIGDQAAVNPLIISRKGTERIVRAALEMASRRNGAPADGVKRVTCVDKANVAEAYAFFYRVFEEIAEQYPGVESEHILADAMTVHMLQRPEHFDVIVAENMLGDILSDLGSGTVGGLGLAPSMEVGDRQGLFQPIHGSAPDIAGKGISNPIAAILSAAMMFKWLGEKNGDEMALGAGLRIERAAETVLAMGRVRTPDLGGESSTAQVGDAVAEAIRRGGIQRFHSPFSR